MTAIDDDVRGRAERLRKLDTLALPAGHRERRARVGHRMQVEQIVDGVVERPQLTRAVELDARARALEHLRRPQPVEVLVDTARRKRLRRIERPVSGDIGEADGIFDVHGRMLIHWPTFRKRQFKPLRRPNGAL